MGDRFDRLFLNNKYIYVNGAPIIVEAGALLKDNVTQELLVQLKFRSISNKTIKAVTVCINTKDTAGRILDNRIEYQYLDLNIDRGVEFGQKTAIKIENKLVRGFDVYVSEVCFFDGTVWCNSKKDSHNIEEPNLFSKCDGVTYEIEKQYRIEYGDNKKYLAKDIDDLWYCGCGCINHSNESKCHNCRVDHDKIINIDLESLRKNSVQRIEKEEQDREQLQKEQEEKMKKYNKFLKVAALFAIVLITLIVVNKYLIKPMSSQKARISDIEIEIDSGEYFKALSDMNSLENTSYIENRFSVAEQKALDGLISEFKTEPESMSLDSIIVMLDGLEKDFFDRNKIAEVKNFILDTQYNKAIALLEIKDFEAALDIFENINDFKESQNYIDLINREYSLQLANIGDIVIIGGHAWIVLEKSDYNIKLLSQFGIGSKAFNSTTDGGEFYEVSGFKITRYETSSIYKYVQDFCDKNIKSSLTNAEVSGCGLLSRTYYDDNVYGKGYQIIGGKWWLSTECKNSDGKVIANHYEYVDEAGRVISEVGFLSNINDIYDVRPYITITF